MFKGYLLDLDGTIYLGDHVIPAGKRFIERLQEKGLPYLLVTNNSSRLPEQVSERLAEKFDIHVPSSHVYTSSMATADYLDGLNHGKKVYVIGQEGLKTYLERRGYQLVSSHHENPDYVVVGLDQQVNYEKFAEATLAIRNGATFIGTNPDRNIPTHEGLLPSAGPNIAFLESATRQKATIIGKPEAIMMDSAVERLGLSKEEVVMVGDNYETDIQAGLKNHIPALLVLSGFTQRDDLASVPQQPDYIVDSLDEWEI